LKLITTIADEANIEIDKLRQIGDTLRDHEPKIIAVLAIAKDDKITVMAACGKDAVAKGVKAGDIIREVTKICGGSGGGKPEFAMGGGKDASKLKEALEAVDGIVVEKITNSK
jgi:alanyl-tRNA synthetase